MSLKPIVMPTGYEEATRKAATKRRLAQMMMERGLGSQGPMQSWTQVLGQLGSAWAGKRLEKKADKLESGAADQMRSDYATKLAEFHKVTGGGASPDAPDVHAEDSKVGERPIPMSATDSGMRSAAA